MPICTYLSDAEKKAYRTVKDRDIAELLDEIEKQTGERLLVREHRVSLRKRRWFRIHTEEKVYYQLYIDFEPDDMEVQIFNFAVDNADGGSLNTYATRANLLNLLFGWSNGIDIGRKKPTPSNGGRE